MDQKCHLMGGGKLKENYVAQNGYEKDKIYWEQKNELEE